MQFAGIGIFVIYDPEANAYQVVGAEGIDEVTCPSYGTVRFLLAPGAQISAGNAPAITPINIGAPLLGGPPMVSPPVVISAIAPDGRGQIDVTFYGARKEGIAPPIPTSFSLFIVRMTNPNVTVQNAPLPIPPPPVPPP